MPEVRGERGNVLVDLHVRGLADRDQAGVEVDVLALKRDRLPDPHAGDGKQPEQRLIARRAQRTGQLPRFL